MSKAELETLRKSADLDRVMNFLKVEKVLDGNIPWEKVPFHRPLKSDKDDGYSGRLVIHEVLHVTPTIKNLIIKGASSDELEDQAKKEGMMTMIEDGIFKVVQGITTLEEVLRVISD